MKGRIGFVYVATDPDYTAMALESIRSLRRFWKGPIALFTDQNLTGQHLDVDGVIVRRVPPAPGLASREIKLRLSSITPFEHSIYLDADTQVVAPVDELVALASRCTFAAALDIERDARKQLRRPGDAEELAITLRETSGVPFYNGGVIAFDKRKARPLFIRWLREWRRFRTFDQPALQRTLAATGIRPTTVPVLFNVLFPWYGQRTGGVVIVHLFRSTNLRQYNGFLSDARLALSHPLLAPVGLLRAYARFFLHALQRRLS